MAVTARQNNKQRRDGNPPPSNANRRGAWRGGPPSFAHQSNRGPVGPPQGQHGFGSSQPPRSSLLGVENALNAHIVVTTRNGVRHSGYVDSIDPDSSGFTLRSYRDLSAPNMPEKESMRFPAVQLLHWQRSEPPPANGAPATPAKGFRTDADISQNGPNPRERELQAWSDGASAPGSTPSSGPTPGSRGDDVTFGSAGSGSWDQFTVNQQLFGVTTNYDEELYTTKLDRSRPDFKERERNAQQIANEIQNSTTNNLHVAEERGALDDSGVNEEDKYGAVVRGPNAYVPPAARNNALPASTGSSPSPAGATPVSGSNDTPKATKPNGSEPSAAGPTGPPKENNLVGSFRDFVTNEKQRLVQKKQQIVKKEKDNRLADLLKFSQEFKLNRPIPEDLVPILAKEESKQKELLEKSRKEAESSGARAIGATITTAAASRGPLPTVLKPEVRRPPVLLGPVIAANPTAAKLAVKTASITAAAAAAAATTAPAPTPAPAPHTSAPKKMIIQPIPPFKGKRSADASGVSSGNGSATPPTTVSASATPKNTDDGVPASPTSATSSSFKLNVKATSFKPNPNASAFTPVGVTSPPDASPATNSSTPRSESKNSTNHPLFGTSVVKMSAVHIKDDFNPFRHGKVPEAYAIASNWPYGGKRFMSMFLPLTPSAPPPSTQQPPAPQSGQTGQTGQPQVPQGAPPPYEEDPAQAAARTQYPMMYAYAPYPYPTQPMLPVPGAAPPSGYVQSPFVQHMHFPHQGNAHPAAMFAPPPTLNGMPPPQGFIPQPPPGPYPPNGAGPRGSMPPTPMQQHAYAFHQSPQLPHAVPYPMMLPQPAPIPQGAPAGHPYEGQGGPPVQPGAPGPMGVGH